MEVVRTCIHVPKKKVTFADRSDMGCERKRSQDRFQGSWTKKLKKIDLLLTEKEKIKGRAVVEC